MADAYVSTGNQNAITTDITALGVDQSGTPTGRGHVYYFSAGVAGDTTGADQVQGIVAQRTTASGTGTAVVPAPLDPAAAAADLESAENHTAEPTYTAATELWDGSIHLRSLLQVHLRNPWIIPSTANNGIGIFLQSNATATDLWHVGMEWEE